MGRTSLSDAAVWQQLELGDSAAHPQVWVALWRNHGYGRVLDIASGAGRVANALRAEGGVVTALDCESYPDVVVADAAQFSFGCCFQFIACAGGAIHLFRDRSGFWDRVREHLGPDGVVAIEIFEWTSFFGGTQPALVAEVGGHRYELVPLLFLPDDDRIHYHYERRIDGDLLDEVGVELAPLSLAQVVAESGLVLVDEVIVAEGQPSRVMVLAR